MKKIGLIGGIGPESTLLYYKKLVYLANKQRGSDFLPRLTIESLNVFTVLGLCKQMRFEDLVAYLKDGLDSLIAAGSEVIAMTANTPHIVHDRLQRQIQIPIVSIVEATCEEAKKRRCARVGLLGTRFTMDSTFYKKPFWQAGIEIVTPNPADMTLVDAKISQELEKGFVKDNTRRKFLEIIDKMREQAGIDTIILGCTELPLLFDGIDLPMKCLDTVDIHVESILEAAE